MHLKDTLQLNVKLIHIFFFLLFQYYGFILYRHKLEKSYSNPTSLVTNGTRDRGYVMVDGVS